jgi:hypothetical protein
MIDEDKLNYIKKAYNNDYHTLNAILSHLRICSESYYDEFEPKKQYMHFENELADLFILLSVYMDNEKHKKILNERINKFIQKIISEIEGK